MSSPTGSPANRSHLQKLANTAADGAAIPVGRYQRWINVQILSSVLDRVRDENDDPLFALKEPRSPRYLSEQERIQIADLVGAKVTVRGIAAELGRAPSTISREIRPNSDQHGRYLPHHAEQAARLRAAPRPRRHI